VTRAGVPARRPQPPRCALAIFDAFNTIVRPVAGAANTFAAGLRAAGIEVSAAMMGRLQSASAGLDHRAWSVCRADYADWTARTLRSLRPQTLRESEPAVIPALEQWHQAPMEQFADVSPCLTALRHSGIIIAVCSNWGWDLSDDLGKAGLGGLVDIAVSSASAGCRKPHSLIYQRVLDLAGVGAAEAVFVGDDLANDVAGPLRAGIASVLLDRAGAARPGVSSVRSLADLAAWILGQPQAARRGEPGAGSPPAGN
jgi:putative hydrolase of the HAD superfamily